ncbi:MAG: hypothetical protein D6775_13950, partial [Caldilineae bacterium]
MGKKVYLLLSLSLLLLIAAAAPAVLAAPSLPDTNAGVQAGSGPEATPAVAPQEPESVNRTIAPPGAPGFYIGNGRNTTPLPAADYFAAGSFTFWSWRELEPGRGHYNWGFLDQWIQDQVDAGYQGVGIAVYTYIGRYTPCPAQGVDVTPAWVLAGQDGVRGTSDDPVLVSDQPDGRDGPGCTNFGGDWYLLDYEHPWYRNNYRDFILALGEHLTNSPLRDHIAWVATGIGKDGENRAADNRNGVARDEDFLNSQGLTVDDWITYARDVIDWNRQAFYDGSGFPRIQVVTQNAPFYLSTTSRRAIAQYAASKRVGVSINGMTSDFQGTELCDSTDPNLWCTGMYDQARLYNDTVPVMFESYRYMMGTVNEFYWSMARALDLKGDYLRLSDFWGDGITNEENLTIAEWASQYFGKGFEFGEERPPSIWSRMREHRDPCPLYYVSGLPSCNWWPTNGNYEFYLTQLHLPEQGGVTIPVTDDPRIRITGWDHSQSTVVDKPWHYNTNPYDANLAAAGLFHPVNPDYGIQIEADPGFVARRSDQANGQSKFIFDAADAYFARSQPPAESTFKVIITVTYLDVGNDQWLLIYDSVSGPKPAQVYAINDWTIRRGLNVDGTLPTTGKLTEPTFYVQKTDSKKWKVATFVIEDGNFNNMVLNEANADFYIESRGANGEWDGDEYIHHV